MCTVTYFPVTRSSFIITQNRDEHYSRPQATPPQISQIEGRSLLFPKDPTGNGTWMCASQGRVVCLLNGAFGPHIFMPPYKKSRGLVVLDSFNHPNALQFASEYDFTDIEPFTMIWLQQQKSDTRMFRGNRHEWELHEIKWDGNERYHQQHDAGNSYIWSSATLYSNDMHAKRIKWWTDWQKNELKNFPDDVLRFHHNGGDGDKRTDVCMNRGDIISSVSISSIFFDKDFTFYYEDLKQKIKSETKLMVEPTI